MPGCLLRPAICLGLCAAVAVFPSLGYAQEADAPPTINNVRGDLYTLTHRGQVTVFLVTADGIILGDPLNQVAANWLKKELAARYPDRRVRYVLFSHHHFDRAEGAGPFDAGAELVGHREFDPQVRQAREATPDRYSHVQSPETTYGSRREIVLGGKTVAMVHTGPAHAADMSALYFPAERIVFVVDPPPIDRAPFSFSPFKVADVVQWVHALRGLDFDAVLTGAGETIPREVLVSFGRYLDDLVAGVAVGYERGQSLRQLQASSLLESHRAEPHYAGRDAQIDYAYRTIKFTRADVYGAAALNMVGRSDAYCASYSGCDSGARIPAGMAGFSLSIRRWGGAAEVRFGGQSFSSRTSPLYDDAIARRDVMVSGLLRYSSPPKSGLALAAVAGFSIIHEDIAGQNRVKVSFVPLGGRHDIGSRRVVNGYTVGGDIIWSVASGLSVVMPVRLTKRLDGPSDFAPGPLDVHAGVGLRWNAFRRIS